MSHTTVVRFRAGPVAVAVSAEHVTGIDDHDLGAPHIGTVLGVDTTTAPADRRTVVVRHEQGFVAFTVDPPVSVGELRREDVRPIRGAGREAFPEFLLGYADHGGELVALIDLSHVVARLEARSEEE